MVLALLPRGRAALRVLGGRPLRLAHTGPRTATEDLSLLGQCGRLCKVPPWPDTRSLTVRS
jgi:hypothetical protein